MVISASNDGAKRDRHAGRFGRQVTKCDSTRQSQSLAPVGQSHARTTQTLEQSSQALFTARWILAA